MLKAEICDNMKAEVHNMIQQEFDLNMIPESEPIVIHVNQYDEGASRLIIHLYNGSQAYTPNNATVKIQGTKPDKKGFQYYARISGSTVTADVNLQMTAVKGRVYTQVVVTESTGNTGTFAFILDVQESALVETVDVSETDLPAIIDAAESSAERAEAASLRYPYIGDNNNWYVYDIETDSFIDTGVKAKGEDGTSSHYFVGDTLVLT